MQPSYGAYSCPKEQPSVRAVANHFLTTMNKHPLAEVAVTATPPTAITGLQLSGVPLSDIVLLLNGIYIALGIVYLIYKMVKKDKKDDT